MHYHETMIQDIGTAMSIILQQCSMLLLIVNLRKANTKLVIIKKIYIYIYNKKKKKKKKKK